MPGTARGGAVTTNEQPHRAYPPVSRPLAHLAPSQSPAVLPFSSSGSLDFGSGLVAFFSRCCGSGGGRTFFCGRERSPTLLSRSRAACSFRVSA